SIPKANVSYHSQKIRDVLTSMNLELGRNEKGDYANYIVRLRNSGRDLYNALLPAESCSPARGARARMEASGSFCLTVHSDCSVHIPWGFIYDGHAARPGKSLRPEIKNFEGFWLSRHWIATRFYGGGCSKESWVIDPRQFAVLYALNQKEFQD